MQKVQRWGPLFILYFKMKNSSKSAESILGIVVGFLILFAITRLEWMLWICLVVGILGLFSKTFAHWIDWAWGKFAMALGFVNSRILLSLVFYLILFPIAFLYRLTQKDTLQLKNPQDSVYKERNHTYQAEDLDKMW